MSKRSKGHGRGGRGGWGEQGGAGAGPRLPTEEEIANTGKNKSNVTQVLIVRRKGRK